MVRTMSETIQKMQRLTQLHREHQMSAHADETPWNEVTLKSIGGSGVLFRVFFPPPKAVEVTDIGFFVEDVKMQKDSAELLIRHIPLEDRSLIEERRLFVVKGEKAFPGKFTYAPGTVEVRSEEAGVEFGVMHLYYKWRKV
ncbi:MAG TPA: hypothetical protein VLH56_08540 [Dissulfurispiraceae bacterium]|nr:hypothetical protein [Dissulfurispiraceae bacterium]